MDHPYLPHARLVLASEPVDGRLVGVSRSGWPSVASSSDPAVFLQRPSSRGVRSVPADQDQAIPLVRRGPRSPDPSRERVVALGMFRIAIEGEQPCKQPLTDEQHRDRMPGTDPDSATKPFARRIRTESTWLWSFEDLIASVKDAQLRDALRATKSGTKNRTRFGLVYERHLPDTLCLGVNGGLRERVDQVRLREQPEEETILRVKSVRGAKLSIVDETGKATKVATADLLAIKGFGYPIFSDVGLQLERLKKARTCPYHAVINGQTYHTLQLLLHTCEGQVDCIYIDPPYNTVARDRSRTTIMSTQPIRGGIPSGCLTWRSAFVSQDAYANQLGSDSDVRRARGSPSWSSTLAAIPRCCSPVVTIVNNPKGCDAGVDSPASRSTQPFASLGMRSSLGSATISSRCKPISPRLAASHVGRDFCALVMKLPQRLRRHVYPVLFDLDREAVLGAGEPLPFKKYPDFDLKIEGLTPVWPVRRDGSLGRWSVGRTTLRQLIEKGYVALGSYQSSRRTWSISYLSKQLQEQVETGVLSSMALMISATSSTSVTRTPVSGGWRPFGTVHPTMLVLTEPISSRASSARSASIIRSPWTLCATRSQQLWQHS